MSHHRMTPRIIIIWSDLVMCALPAPTSSRDRGMWSRLELRLLLLLAVVPCSSRGPHVCTVCIWMDVP